MNLSVPVQNTRAMPLVPRARADTCSANPSLLEDPHLCIVLGHIALYKRALIADIELLLSEYAKTGASGFQPFLAVWKELRFSIIHMGCTEKQGREVFMNCIYQILLSYLQTNYLRRIQNAAIYALYMMYFTQPFSFPKVGIRLTIDKWEALETFYGTACEQAQDERLAGGEDHSWEDVVYTIHKLREADAFLFVARDDPIGTIMPFDREDALESTEMKLLQLEREIMTKTMETSPFVVDELAKFDKLYHLSKQSLLATKITEQAIERVQGKLQRGEQLRSMSNSRLRRINHSLNPASILFDPLGHLDEQLQTLRGVRASDEIRVSGSESRGTSRQPQQQDEQETSSDAATTSSAMPEAVASMHADATLRDTSSTVGPGLPLMPGHTGMDGEGFTRTVSDTCSADPARIPQSKQKGNALFSSSKSDIAHNFEDMMKQHVKTRWKRLDYAVQGKLDRFSRETRRTSSTG